MTTAIISFLSKVANPGWLTGPIFGKELRVSSRRRRNYVLRFVYLGLLTIYVVMVWSSSVNLQQGPSAVYGVSRMSVAGTTIIAAIVTFQFLVTQLIAVIMLSTAISDEIYHHTLGLLMTTPINSFQIVMGKLLSKLLQLILLLAISLPLLAIVRVFGGVPWRYVLSSLCITLTAVIFAGSLSLYLSIGSRRAYYVILKTLFILGFLFGFIPAISAVLLRRYVSQSILMPVLLLPNPFTVMQFNTIMMMSPAAVGGSFSLCWFQHCALMLGAAALLLARSVQIVRRVALRQATGQIDTSFKRRHRPRKIQPAAGTSEIRHPAGTIRRVSGSPVIWKELRAPIIQGADRKNSIIGLVVTIVALLITYAVCVNENCLYKDFAQVSYTLVFVFLGLIVNMVLSATSITTEKEARSWPLLLATSMDDWQILFGKAVGVIRRCLPIWFLLAVHVLLFVFVGYIHPIAIVHLLMLVGWIVVFLTGSGLYFSSRFKRTTGAVVANLAMCLGLWAVTPALFGLVSEITGNDYAISKFVLANPVVQAIVIMAGAGGKFNAQKSLANLRYNWPFGKMNIGTTTTILLITMVTYISLGLLFAWRAKCRMRRNIF